MAGNRIPFKLPVVGGVSSAGGGSAWPGIIEHGGILNYAIDPMYTGVANRGFNAPFAFDADGYLWYNPRSKTNCAVVRFICPDGDIVDIALTKPIKSDKIAYGGRLYPYFDLDPNNKTVGGVTLHMSSAPPSVAPYELNSFSTFDVVAITAVECVGTEHASYPVSNIIAADNNLFYNPTPDGEGYAGVIFTVSDKVDAFEVRNYSFPSCEFAVSTDGGVTWEDYGVVTCRNSGNTSVEFMLLPEYKATGSHKIRLRSIVHQFAGSTYEWYMYQMRALQFKDADEKLLLDKHSLGAYSVVPYAYRLYGQASQYANGNNMPYRMVLSDSANSRGHSCASGAWFGLAYNYSPVIGVSTLKSVGFTMAVGAAHDASHTTLGNQFAYLDYPSDADILNLMYNTHANRYEDPCVGTPEAHSVRFTVDAAISLNYAFEAVYAADTINNISGVTTDRWTGEKVARTYYGGYCNRLMYHEDSLVQVPTMVHINAGYGYGGFNLWPFREWVSQGYYYTYNSYGWPWMPSEMQVQCWYDNGADALSHKNQDEAYQAVHDNGEYLIGMFSGTSSHRLTARRTW